MSSFIELIPSQYHYFNRFKELDETDFAIILEMKKTCPDGPRNVRKTAQKLEMPQQTVNYRVLRWAQRDLVRFRAIANNELLGLGNFVAFIKVKPGLLYENKRGTAVNSGTFLTCYSVWRVLKEIHGGSAHGFFVQYSIPANKENNLRLFLEELKKIGCIDDFTALCRVTSAYSNTPSLDLYTEISKQVKSGRPVSFNWENWIDSFEGAEEATLPRESSPVKKITVSYEHLLTLSYLEQNLRQKFVNIARSIGEPSSSVKKWYEEIRRQRIITDCKVEIYPTDPKTSLHLVLKLGFNREGPLRKFIMHLNSMPYPARYQKILNENVIFLHIIIPAHEYFDFHNAIEIISRRKNMIEDFNQYLSSYYSSFDNVQLYEAFSKEENRWVFSYEIMKQKLKQKLDDTKFKF